MRVQNFRPREKQFNVEAIRVSSNNVHDIANWTGGEAYYKDVDSQWVVRIPTLEGPVDVETGEYVVHYPNTNRFSGHTEEQFDAKYEMISRDFPSSPGDSEYAVPFKESDYNPEEGEEFKQAQSRIEEKSFDEVIQINESERVSPISIFGKPNPKHWNGHTG